MDNDTNLKELWSKQTTAQPQTDELFSHFARIKKKNLTTIITVNISMAATIVYILFIGFYFEPKLMTTKIGIAITVLGIIIYLFFYNLLIPRLKKISENMSNTEFLQAVINLKKEKRFLQSIMLNIYFLTLTLGLSLYLFEYISLLPFPWSIFPYTFTLIWIGFNWFYLRPRIAVKQQNKLNEIIKKLEDIQKQN
jgi:hypothetical protein